MTHQLRFEFGDPSLDNVPPDASSHLPSVAGQPRVPPSNEVLSQALTELATSLQVQGANRFRVEAYFLAANSLLALPKPAWQIFELEGTEGLTDIPGVNRAIANGLAQLIRGARWPLLDFLNGDCALEKTFAGIAAIGPKTAKQIVSDLGIDSLADLQTAAWDGRLETLNGIGKKRLNAIRESLAGRGRTGVEIEENGFHQIPVAEILDVDDQYRFESTHKTLKLVKPRKNNPIDATWLPILHTQRGSRHYTVMFSNSAQAHQQRKTRDWVIVLLDDENQPGFQVQWTVITSEFGRLKGRRIVRRRERDCEAYYQTRK